MGTYHADTPPDMNFLFNNAYFIALLPNLVNNTSPKAPLTDKQA